jgi:hypothetical protein
VKLKPLRVLNPRIPEHHRFDGGYDVLRAVIAPDQIAAMVDVTLRVREVAGPVTEITLKTRNESSVMLVNESLSDIEKKIQEATS